MGRVFRSLAIGYGKSKRIQVQTVKQRFTFSPQATAFIFDITW
jgi:hypothetical protein